MKIEVANIIASLLLVIDLQLLFYMELGKRCH